MTSAPSTTSRVLGFSPTTAAILIIAATTLVRFFYAVWLPILPDEAYYFQWSRHLDASYFSKGPAVAWTIATGAAMFGGNNLGVRFFAVMLSAGTAWQIFLLARRWYDETVALISVLIAGVLPIYAIGAVVMTIDPLSAFFWIWAANCFSAALEKDRLLDWILAGFAVGCGFLAKYLSPLELLSFLAFLLIVPERRRLLRGPGFWTMLLVTLLCTTPVIFWNAQHEWITFHALADRGKLNKTDGFKFNPSGVLNFLIMQALVVSPGLFIGLLITAFAFIRRRLAGDRSEGELLLFTLFVPVFAMYFALSFHMKGEANWPVVSYLTLIIIMASYSRRLLIARGLGRAFAVAAFALAWLQTLIMHDMELLHLKPKNDPMSRVSGWGEVAGELDRIRAEQHADVLIADAYKEASVLSFHMPGQPFIFAKRNVPPANQYDMWAAYPKDGSHRALWITEGPDILALQHDFKSVTFLERIIVSYHGVPRRAYSVYLCENRP